MQLFITSFHIENNLLYIKEERVLNQIRKVLRWKAWYVFQVQNFDWKIIDRITVSLVEYQKNLIVCNVLEKISKEISASSTWIIISILNKYDKMNLIVQKLSEIWLPNIYFWNADRSVINTINDKKFERFSKISLEAVEQSKWWILPNIKIIPKLENIVWEKELLVLDIDWIPLSEINLNKIDNKKLLIWPEWWFSEKDYTYLQKFLYEKINIWQNVYRAETAWIIWWWLLKIWLNNK
jgi:RsmE family RNA methyltransferase